MIVTTDLKDPEVQAFIEHYGKKGMHWGVRRGIALNKTAKSIRRGVSGGAKAIGRGTKRSAKWVNDHKKEIAIVAAGTIATGVILKHHQNVKVKNLRMSHIDFIKSKEVLDRKMSTRLADLRDLAKMTPEGHSSHEGAMKEITSLHEFYKHRMDKVAKRHSVDPKTLKKMKLGDFK